MVVLVPKELHNRKEVVEAKEKELELLKKFEIYEETYAEDIKPNSEIVSSVWVITEKDFDGG